jgi:chitodextrinase
VRKSAADVTLQVVPRGDGVVTSGANSCDDNEEPGECKWTFPSGTTVTLTAKPDSGETFSRWSSPDCPGTTTTCQVTVDEDTTIVALFGRLTLRVETSGRESDDFITIDPGGLRCPTVCEPRFAPGTSVKLTVTTKAPSTFTSFPYGCESTSANTCTLTVFDDGQQVGVKFNNSPGPVADAVVNVKVKVRKAGDGAGRVTAGGLDCGGTCTASFPYGTLVSFAASADQGSLFGGWGGICANDKDPTCRLPIGAITLVRPRFVRDAAPGAPGTPSVTAATASSVTVTWTAATDDVGVKGYDVFVGAATSPRLTTTATTATIDGLQCGRTYAISIEATDATGNRSPRATVQAATVPCALRVKLVSAKVSRAQLVCRFSSSARASGSASLVVRGKVAVRKKVSARAGINTVVFRLPRSAHGVRVGVVMRLGSPARTFSWSVRVR